MATTVPALLRRSARLGKRSKSGLQVCSVYLCLPTTASDVCLNLRQESTAANKKRKTRDMHKSLASSDPTVSLARLSRE